MEEDYDYGNSDQIIKQFSNNVYLVIRNGMFPSPDYHLVLIGYGSIATRYRPLSSLDPLKWAKSKAKSRLNSLEKRITTLNRDLQRLNEEYNMWIQIKSELDSELN